VNSQKIKITKASGKKDFFDASKLKRSLEHSGADKKVIEQIIAQVEAALYNGISTHEIYNKAFLLLRKYSRPFAARYKLKNAIMELGPTGYPFEKFVGEILSYEGYQADVGVIVEGHCVNHEVDVVAKKDTKHFMVECKFHSHRGRHCDVKIPLYIQSRFIDISKQWEKISGDDNNFHQGWIFTNTRFTSEAIQYGNCVGLKLVGWDYPKQGSLKDRIDASGLHPVTCLTTITKKEKQKLLSINNVLCMDLCKTPSLLHDLGIKANRIKKILNEAHELCNLK
jgi:hypothetical protein